MTDLDRLFDQRRSSLITVDEVFVDRAPYLAAFDGALRALWDRPEPAGLAGVPRRNVLAFHGLGGIGKSTLSQELQRRFHRHDTDRQRLSCRIDLDDGTLADLETCVIALRGTLGEAVSSCPAFDLSFAVYWERRHPGVPLRSALARNSALARFNQSLALAEQVDTTLDALLGPVPLAGLARRTAALLIDRIRERQSRERLLAECPGFAELVGAEDPADMLPFLPAMLSWDLAEHRRRKALEVVVFLDTFERIDGLREPGSLADQLARLVYLLPNVLFVVTGRNRLVWGDAPHPALHYSGPHYWPGLSAGGGGRPGAVPAMQHWLRGLADTDADTYLRLRLTQQGAPAIPERLRSRIVGASGGVPLYLELSAELFDQLSAGGRQPEEELFGGTFSEMVIRVMRDLSADERALLRAASLTSRFDTDLLRAAVPGVRDAVIRRFLARPLVQTDRTRWLPHTVDEYVRDAVRLHDQNTDDAWSTAEWATAADRCLDHLRGLLHDSLQDPAAADRTRMGEGFTVASLLTVVAGHVPDWLYDLSYALYVCDLGSVLAAARDWPVPSTESPTAALALNCQGMAARASGDRIAALTLTERAHAFADLSPHQRLFVSYRLAKVLEENGRYAAAQQLVSQVAATPGPLRENAEKDLAWIGWLRGDGRRLRTWALPLVDSPLGLRRAQSRDLLGQFSFLQGDFRAAEEYLRRNADDPELAAAGMARDTSLRHLGMVLAVARPLDAEAVLDRAHEVNREVGTRIGVAQTLIWTAVARAGRGPAAEVTRLLAEGEELLTRSGGGADQWMALTARLFLAAVDGTTTEVRTAGETLVRATEEQDCHPGLAEIAQRWLAVRGIEMTVPQRGYWENRESSLAAWERVLTERRRARGPASDA